MSREDSDVDYWAWLSGEGQPLNAECADCGIEYSKAEDDPTTWCDACSDRRDRWASAMELKAMAKAVLAVDLTKIKDIA